MIIYDIEIKNAIPDRRNARLPEVNYCEGWTDFRGMGIATIGVYDYKSDRSRVFCDDNLDDFRRLVDATDIVCGFNNLRFDNKVLEAHGVIVPAAKTFDLLREIWRGLDVLGLFETSGFSDAHKGYSLEAVARTNCGVGKSGDGANAPVLWQRGEVGSVIDYCLADVALTKKLVDKVLRFGYLFNPNFPKDKICIRRPAPED